jgi:PKD repeat protein
VLLGALCKGSGAVLATGLIPGALVRFFSGAAELGDAQAPSPSYTFALPDLTAGAEITAKQELCSAWSPASNGLTVGAHPTGGTPKIAGPVQACAGAVRVLGVQPGNWVEVLSSDLAGPIGQGLATGTSIDLVVAPQLIKGDHITSKVSGCGSTVTSAGLVVQAAPTGIKPPYVDQTIEGQESVTVTSVDPGAFVEVFVNNIPCSSGFAAVSVIVLPISFPLAVGDRVSALQRMCTVASGFSPVVTTVPPPPTARFSAVPTSGIKPLSVQFTDESTGESIDKWKWSFDDPESPDPTSALQSPSHTFQTAQTCNVTLQAGNAGGWSARFSLPIDVLPPPPQATAKAAPPVGSFPQVVQFSVQPAPGSVITSYAWDFDDPGGEGPNTSGDPDPQHTYTQLGTFNPTLTISNAGGSTTVTVNAVQITQAKPMLFVAADETVTPVKFTITGSGYLANTSVLIAYLVPSLNEQGSNNIPSDSFGAIHGSGEDTAGVCNHQTVLISWTATDGRHDPGSPDGKLYSPVFQLHC